MWPANPAAFDIFRLVLVGVTSSSDMERRRRRRRKKGDGCRLLTCSQSAKERKSHACLTLPEL